MNLLSELQLILEKKAHEKCCTQHGCSKPGCDAVVPESKSCTCKADK